MPLIQSKKYPEHEHFVTVEDWKIMQDKGLNRRFRIVDDGDIQDTVIAKPASFAEVINPTIENFAEPEMTRDDLKKWLDDNEIEYNTRTSTEKLNQLYIDNQ